MLISSAHFSACHPVTPTPRSPPLPPPLVRFPELGVFHVLSPFLTWAGSPLLRQPGGPPLPGGHHIDAELKGKGEKMSGNIRKGDRT